ncbi:MAG TPA: translation initiation factor IF-2 [Thermaerobacter sp.]
MTSYARLQRAAATLRRVGEGLDFLAAGAASEEERERLRRAAVQARVMYEGLERRLRQVQEAREREAQGEPVEAGAAGPGEPDQGAGTAAAGAATGHRRPGSRRRRAGSGTTPRRGQSGAR